MIFYKPFIIYIKSFICYSKTLFLETTDLPVSRVRVDIIDETIEDINNILEVAYNRKKLEGNNYTNGNLYREV